MLRIGNFELGFKEVPGIEQVKRYGIQFFGTVEVGRPSFLTY